jgi:hypothetical protein
MTESDQWLELQHLLDLQNQDGGWSYGVGGSWTEPTCYALMALAAAGQVGSEPARRAAQWLAVRQRSDGGWSPRDTVPESTWVTSLLLLLPEGVVSRTQADRALAWLVAQTGRESGIIYRLRMRLLVGHLDPQQQYDGWPWYPDAAAWVAPTSLSILALRKKARAADARTRERIDQRITQGQRYLLARRCRDGGWNHGSSKALGYDSDSYPETTGVALLALNDSTAPELATAESLAERQLAAGKSCEGASWLRLALLARGRRPAGSATPRHPRTLELAMALLAGAAENGRNVFLERA